MGEESPKKKQSVEGQEETSSGFASVISSHAAGVGPGPMERETLSLPGAEYDQDGPTSSAPSSAGSSSSRISLKIPKSAVANATEAFPSSSSKSGSETDDQESRKSSERGRNRKDPKRDKKQLGRKRRKNEDDDEESAYSEDSEGDGDSDSEVYSEEDEDTENGSGEGEYDSEEEWDDRRRKYARKQSPTKGSGHNRSYVPPISIPYTYTTPIGYMPVQPLPPSMAKIPLFANMRPNYPPNGFGTHGPAMPGARSVPGVASGAGTQPSPMMMRPPAPIQESSLSGFTPNQIQLLTKSVLSSLTAPSETSSAACPTGPAGEEASTTSPKAADFGAAKESSPAPNANLNANFTSPSLDSKILVNNMLNDPEARMALMLKMRQHAISSGMLRPMEPAGMMPYVQGQAPPMGMYMPPPGSMPGIPVGQYRPPPAGILRQLATFTQQPIPAATHRVGRPSKVKSRSRSRRSTTSAAGRQAVLGADENVTIASRRPRRTTGQKIDYSQYFKKDEEEFESDSSIGPEGEDLPKAPKKSRSARPRKSSGAAAVDSDEDALESFDEDGEVENLAGSRSSEDTGVEKILSFRKNEDGKLEFYVKFHNLSYFHCEWISEGEMIEESTGATRIKKFMSKPLNMRHYSDKHIFNPEYTQIERIVTGWQHPDDQDSSVMAWSFLVKWSGLPYSDASWEKKSTIEGLPEGPEMLRLFETRPTLKYRKEHSAPENFRPAGEVPRLEESPACKGSNSLFSYQLEGLNWLVHCWSHRQSCIIADEMGLGKTVQSVAFLNYIYNKFDVRGPFLIVAPLSTIPHWQREFEAWTDLNVILYHGNIPSRDMICEYEFYYKDENDHIVPGYYKFDVLITTYEMAMSGFEHLQSIKWRAAVFDEAHRLKNKSSKASETLSELACEHKVLLSGTPLQNNVEELFSLLHFMQPEKFASEEKFVADFGNLQRSDDVIRLQEMLRPLMLRRLKEDVEKSIPVKEETVVEVELTSVQKRYYRAILERNFAFLTKGCRGANAPNLINAMMELRKCCIHPYLIKGAEERIVHECNAASFEEQMNCMVQASGKLVLVDKLLKKLRENGHKVLIFSQMTRCLDLLVDFLRWRGYPYERIDGAVRGDLRQAAIDRFCEPESDSFVFLLCTRAGGVGINLTAADTVVIFDSDWNPQNDIQAQARCHRIGQTKSVKVYRLLTRNTYEREMFDKAGMKLGLDRAILRKMLPNETLEGASHNPQLSKKEVETLLKKGAYGLLMENDDDAIKFCEEDIDQILERRTTVIRHEGGAGAAAEGGSIFSKASFSAQPDAADVDIDDPNFWEVWARRLNLDPRQLLNSSGVVVDEPRIKRQARRLRGNLLINPELDALFAKGTAGYKPKVAHKGSEAVLWSDAERAYFLQELFRIGIHRIEEMIPNFPNRSKNDLVACTRAVIKLLLESIEEEEDGRMREDNEKLLLAHLDFDRSAIEVIDESTGKYDLAAAEMRNDEAASVSESATSVALGREFSKADIPFSGASRQQIHEFRSFLRTAPVELSEPLKKHGKVLLLRIQLLDFVRQLVESHSTIVNKGKSGGKKVAGGKEKGPNAPSAAAGEVEYHLPIPNIVGSGPVRGWGKNEDEALIVGVYRHGFGRFNQIKEDTALVFSTMTWDLPNVPATGDSQEEPVEDVRDEDAPISATLATKKVWPSDEDLEERLKKVVLTMEKRTQAAAKLAIQAANSAERGPRRKTIRLEDGDEMYQEDDAYDEDGGRRAAARKGAMIAGTTVSRRGARGHGIEATSDGLSIRWSKRDRGEFQRVVLSFGLPSEDSSGRRDWSRFREMGDFANTITRAGNVAFDEYCSLFVKACRQAAEKRGRKKQLGSDDEFSEADEDDSLPTIPVERAKRALAKIEMFKRLRSQIINLPDLASYLERVRKTSGFPAWWDSHDYDVSLLEGIAKHGVNNWEAIVADEELSFRYIYISAHPEWVMEPVEAEPAQTPVEEEPKKRRGRPKLRETPAKPVGPPVELSRIDWPNEATITRRIEQLMEVIQNEERRRSAAAKEEDAGAGKRRRPIKLTVHAGRKQAILSHENAADTGSNDSAIADAGSGKRRRSTRAPPAPPQPTTARQKSMLQYAVRRGN